MQMDGRLSPGLQKRSPEPWGECFLLLLHSDHGLVVKMECIMYIWEILVNKMANSVNNVHRMEKVHHSLQTVCASDEQANSFFLQFRNSTHTLLNQKKHERQKGLFEWIRPWLEPCITPFDHSVRKRAGRKRVMNGM